MLAEQIISKSKQGLSEVSYKATEASNKRNNYNHSELTYAGSYEFEKAVSTCHIFAGPVTH